MASRRRDRQDSGFTLIELLVVMTILGVLAAIALPVFLSQRQKAVEATVEADLRQVAQLMETFYVDQGRYAPSRATLSAAIPPPTVFSEGNDVDLVDASTTGQFYCLIGTNEQSRDIYYDSDGGGLLPPDVPCT